MRIIKFLVLSFLIYGMIFPQWLFPAEHNLDEAIARKARHSTNTWGKDYFEDASNHYIWQPETLSFVDTVSGHETWIVTHAPDPYVPSTGEYFSKNPSTECWSADGSRIGFINIYSYRGTNNADIGDEYDWRFVVNSDGTKLRALEGFGRQVGSADFGFAWAHTLLNTYYDFGNTGEKYPEPSGTTGYSYKLYKMVMDSNNVITSATEIADTSSTDTEPKNLFGISTGDTRWFARDNDTYRYITPTPPDNIKQMGVYFGDLEPTPSYDTFFGVARGFGPSTGGANGYGNWNRTETGVIVTKGATTNFAVADGTAYWTGMLFYTNASVGDWDAKKWCVYAINGNDLTVRITSCSGSGDTSTYAEPPGGGITIEANTKYIRSGKGVGKDFNYISTTPGGAMTLSGQSIWKISGSASDGGPAWEDWDGDSFGTNEEIRILSFGGGTDPDESPDDPYDNPYFGHPAWDRWGRYLCYGTSVNGETPGSRLCDVFNSDLTRRGNAWNPQATNKWAATTGYILGDKVLSKDVHSNFYWECTTAGTSGATEPTWDNFPPSSPTTTRIDYTLTDGTVVWTAKGHYLSTPGESDGSHRSWTGFTDHVVIQRTGGETYVKLHGVEINTGYTGEYLVAQTFTEGSGTKISGNYNAWPRPVQSPDGTKVAFAHSFLNNLSAGGAYIPYIAYAVAYYPYPPEIYSCEATGGTVTARFDWGTDSGTWRGYTQRKWPDETTGEYLPPRETSKFRLWRSADKSTWTPITTVDADIFTKYDFKDGGYKGGQTSYWDITDTPGNGTWYYAITAIETSGLESKSISNIFAITVSGGSGSGSEDTGYPASPGGDSDFYTTAPGAPQSLSFTHKKTPFTADGQYTLEWTEPVIAALVRHYNIYAIDGANPTAIQQRRIASISRNICSGGNCSHVDWLGNTSGTTRYGITAIDTQGNESQILTLDEGNIGMIRGGSMGGGWVK